MNEEFVVLKWKVGIILLIHVQKIGGTGLEKVEVSDFECT